MDSTLQFLKYKKAYFCIQELSATLQLRIDNVFRKINSYMDSIKVKDVYYILLTTK